MLRGVYRRLKGWRFFRRTLERFLHWRIRRLLLRLDHLHLTVSASEAAISISWISITL